MELKKYNDEVDRASGLYSTPEYNRRIKIITALWERMTGYFGTGWVSAYGVAGGRGFKAWMDSLGEFTEEQIARGVKSSLEWDKSFPPTLPQFMGLCKTSRPEEKPNYTERRIEREKQSGKKESLIEHLSRKATTPTAKRELDRIFRILAGEEVETKEESMQKLGLHRRWGI